MWKAIVGLGAAALVGVGVGMGVRSAPEDGLKPDERLAPAARLVGRWNGSGVRRTPDGGEVTFLVVERARWNLAKTAILVEGLGLETEDGETVIGHDAFAMIRFDASKDAIMFEAVRAGEAFAVHELEVAEDGQMAWSMSTEHGLVRFEIDVTADEWREKGLFSRDGETWMTFLEMTLTREEDG